MDPIIVLIAEARTRFRDRLCRFLSGQAGIQVGGEAADGRQALSGAEALQPDILLLDMQLIQIGGFEGIAHIRARSPTETATHERHSAAMAGSAAIPKTLEKYSKWRVVPERWGLYILG